MNFKVKDLGNGAVDIALGATTTIVGLHAVRKMPKYAGWVLLGAGVLAYVVASGFDKGDGNGVIRVTKLVSIAAASVGAVAALNQIGKDSTGVPAVDGIKGIVNKIVPQLNGIGSSLGSTEIQELNERLLGLADEDSSYGEQLTGGEMQESLMGASSLM